jgi:hypothetical protein
LHLQPSIQEKRPSPGFPQNVISFSTLRGGLLLLVFSPTTRRKNKREVIRDHDVDMAYQDEKLDVDKQGGATEISASDAALTRRILLKLDFRYFLAYLSLPSSVYAISSYKVLIIWLHQDLARLNSPLPLFLPGSYQSRQCQNIQSRSKSEYDR